MTVETVWHPGRPVDVRRTLSPLQRGRHDPTHRVDADGSVWRTTLAPTGEATYRISQRVDGEIACQAWGPGAEWVIAGLPELLGDRDSPEGFEPRLPALESALTRNPWLRMPRTNRVMEALVPAVLEQKVTGKEATTAFQHLVRRFGTPAPGPAPVGMVVPPSPRTWRMIPSWDWHQAGVQPFQSRTIVAAAASTQRLEECVGLAPADALARLRLIPGVGEWTAAEVAQRALGDADAISVGDYHLAAFVGWALVGRPVDDAEMVQLLEPWRPHRQRVVRLLGLSGATKPRFGPRLTTVDYRAI
jgi:3-methyladenine DNA glycosylase/8-oxoguanine DNA glycosylase